MPSIDVVNAPSLDLDLLRTFVAVVDAGGFTRAGTRVHRTQSTVSQQIRRLEEDLGCRLIDRNGGAAAPTEEGEVLMGYARRLLAISDEARAALIDPGHKAVVRLGVPEDFAGRPLTDLLSGFAQACPHIRLDTTSGWSVALRRALDADDLDLSLVKRDVDGSPCLARWPERLTWVAGRSADIAADPLPLALFPQGCIYRHRAVQAVEGLGRRWRVAYVGQGLAGVQAAIASGMGLGLLTEDTVHADHRRLGPRHGFPEPPPSELALIAGTLRLPKPVSELAAFLIETVGSTFNRDALQRID